LRLGPQYALAEAGPLQGGEKAIAIHVASISHLSLV
jgi:hypothetical protein